MKKYAFLTAIAVVTAMPAIAKEPKPTGGYHTVFRGVKQ